MRVLHVHNFYQLPGGEDQSFAATGTMLEDLGHEVIRFTLRNDVIVGVGRLTAASKAVWNPGLAPRSVGRALWPVFCGSKHNHVRVRDMVPGRGRTLAPRRGINSTTSARAHASPRSG